MVICVVVYMLGIVKVLIVKLSAFGDIIHALPALDDVLARPDVNEVHWLVDSRFSFVTEVLPPQIKVHHIALKGEHPLREMRRVVKELRAEKFDLALDFQGLIKSSLLARLICPKVYGFDAKVIREKPASWLQESVEFPEGVKHIVQQYRCIAQAPWLDTLPASINYTPPVIHKASQLLALPEGLQEKRPIALLHLGGAWETKVLPEETWLAVARGADGKGYQVVWCWGNEQEQQLAQELQNKSMGLALKTRLNMTELRSLLQQCTVIVAADTGVLHLAAALGTKTISFWGASASWRSSPLSAQDVQIESNPECGPCFKRTCSKFICMDMIKADDIVGHL